MKKSAKKTTKKTVKTPSLLVELMNRKMEAQKSGEISKSLKKFKPQERNKNNSNVGPSWGGRKGN